MHDDASSFLPPSTLDNKHFFSCILHLREWNIQHLWQKITLACPSSRACLDLRHKIENKRLRAVYVQGMLLLVLTGCLFWFSEFWQLAKPEFESRHKSRCASSRRVHWTSIQWSFIPFGHGHVIPVLRNSASSFHWLSSSIFNIRRLSHIRHTSSHLHHMMFQTIQTIYFLWGYDPSF